MNDIKNIKQYIKENQISIDMITETKKDMSNQCKIQYHSMSVKERDGIITDEEFQKYFADNCAKCFYMCDICMYGEDYD